MYTPLNVTIAILWILSALFDYSAYCQAWQLKEYRWDRFKDFVRTKQGQHTLFFQYRFVWRTLLILTLYTAFSHVGIFLNYIIYVVLLLDIFHNMHEMYKKRLRRPVPTNKAVMIIFLSIIIEGLIISFVNVVNIILLLFVFRFFIISTLVLALGAPTRLMKNYIIKKATLKLKKARHLTVIGITGSYGKTTVKEYISHILNQKFNVVKTPHNTNTDIGIARFILKQDFSGINAFVVEMGAYRTGEIKKVCGMVKPKVGILTAINEQHLSLFGSMKNIQSAKYELLRSLPEDGLAVTNADNKYCTELLSELRVKNIETFGIEENNKPTCLINAIKADKSGIECQGIHNGNERKIYSPVLGAHQALNIAPSVITAMYLGLSWEQITKGCETLPTSLETAISTYKYGEAFIIDDSYNSNPDGFKAALELMTGHSSDKRRVVITRGMLELGDRSNELHERMGEEIAFCADELIIINPDFAGPLMQGSERIKDKYALEIVLKYDKDELLEYVKKFKSRQAVILLENRLPQNVHDEIRGIKM